MTSLGDVKEQIKDRVDLAAHIGKDTKLFRSGANFKACCPLPGHSEKTPSFQINTRENYFYCYGCQRGGDIFKYLELTRGVSFMDALKELAEELRIELPKSGKGDFQVSEPKTNAYDLMERATKYFEGTLHKGATPGAIAAQKYLETRNYSLEDAKKFRLGWAPENGRSLAAKLHEQKLARLGQDLGLLARSRDTEDFFRGRLIIPIEDHRGRVVAFSGRALGLADNEGPKYKNSPETLIFKKKEVLYGLSRAVKGAREIGWLTVVEGFFDAWAFERVGIPSVAVMGVALTPEHLARLEKLGKQLILVMDTDRAGIESTKRSLPLLYQHGFEVKVFSDLGGKDPDEWLAQFSGSPEEVSRRLQRAPEGMEWWATQVINEARDKGLNHVQTIHRLEELWPVLQSPAHRRYWIKAVHPAVGMSEAQLGAHFAKIPVERVVKTPLPGVDEQSPLPAVDEVDPATHILQEIAALLVNYGSAWPKIHEQKEGYLLQQVLAASPLELPYARSIQSGQFVPQSFLDAIKIAGLETYVARSVMTPEETSSSRDNLKVLRDLCLQILGQRKNLAKQRLSMELKNSSDDEKTARILQQLQTLSKDFEDLKR